MAKDETREFEPRLGRSRGRTSNVSRSHRSLVVRATIKQGGDPTRIGQARKPSGRFNARGRGRAAAAALEGHGGWEIDTDSGLSPGMRWRARRVVVKARVVKLKGGQSQAMAAHLRYLQREGVTADGQSGHAYSSFGERADAKAFIERSREDRHQFRFIVAAEDGVELGDLKLMTRRLMHQMEQDLDTHLDWIAVDHYNTGHPHTHVVVRGVTDDDKVLYIAGDYIAHGVRARASDLVTRELGRQSEWDVQQKLGKEIKHERFTRLDRTLLSQAEDGQVDLRVSPGQDYLVRVNRHLLLGRLQTLERMELASEQEPGIWRLSSKLEPTLRQLGERMDKVHLMRLALGYEAAERSVATFMIHHELPRSVITGRLAGRGLVGDGLGDEAYVILDGVDGRVHYVELSDTLLPDEIHRGAILTVGRAASARSVDKTIAAHAARNGGLYDPREHIEIARQSERVPGGDFEGHVDGHVRRLEALRRAGIVKRFDANHWEIPQDFLARTAAYDERDGGKLAISVHSTVSIERQITADAATWLDRQLVGRHGVERAPMGFGQKVETALSRRNDYLIAQGLAQRREDGSIHYKADLLATLQRRELDRIGPQLAATRIDGMTYIPAREGTTIYGRYRQTLTLTSGKFAVIATERQFTLVPWRPLLDRHLGREVAGIVRGIGVSWQLGRDRGRSR